MSVIAVTGATGFVGRSLVQGLREDGHTVRALVRPTSYAAPIRGKAQIAYGDLRDPSTLGDFVKDAEVLIHLAASHSPDDDPTELVTQGTADLLTAAQSAGVQRIVFMSCLGADAAARSRYYAAKWKAEQLVRGSGVPYVILRPSLILGRGDMVTRPLAALLRSLPAVPIPGTGQARQQPIDVEDVARCVLLASADKEFLGKEISVGGPSYLTLRQYVDLIAAQLGVSRPKVLVPERFVPSLGRVLPKAGRDLWAGPRLDGLIQTRAASPGIVESVFGFQPRAVTGRLQAYLG